MKLTRLLKRSAVALAVAGACSGAGATTTDLGAITFGATAFNGSASPGLFTDVFKFLAPANGGSAYSVVDFPLTIPFGTFGTSFSSLKLWSNPNGTVGDFDDVQVATGTGGGSSMNLSFGPSVGGNYYLEVKGTATGSLGGLYSGAISLSPIPEPGTYGLFLAGLGLIGTIVTRRRRV
ncbi:MAG: FxDxF family PEP-CTERM protein [Burkholderiales bacterium]|nr:FxDxF family PEP-CTERM protein [Burkholderiales bacterium]